MKVRIMKVRLIIQTLLPLLAAILMVSCGGPDHNDPRSVADAAVKCYADEDIKGMKSLLNPNDEKKLQGFDQFIAMLEAMKDSGVANATSKEDRPRFEDYTFKSITGEYGLPITDNTTEIEVNYKLNTGRTFTVPLEKVDGKWYLSGIPH